MHRSRGFTLIEIMVALAVLALSGIALLSNINQATRDLARLEDKRVALNLAGRRWQARLGANFLPGYLFNPSSPSSTKNSLSEMMWSEWPAAMSFSALICLLLFLLSLPSPTTR